MRLRYVGAIACGPLIAFAGEAEPNGGVLPSSVRPSSGTLVRQANGLAKANKPAEAQIVYESALKAAEQAQGPQSSEVANVLEWQTVFYRSQRKYDEAWGAAERALNIRNQEFGPYHVLTAQIHALLGSIAPFHPQPPNPLHHFTAVLEAYANRSDSEPSEPLAAY